MKRLLLYDKNLNHIGAVAMATEVERRRRINSDNELTFVVPMSSDDYDLIQIKGHVKDERGQYYVINDRSRKRDGVKRMVQFDCMHIMFKLADFKFPYTSYIEEAYGVNITTLLNSISAATGGKFTFSIDDTFDKKDVKDFGRGNCLQALNQVIELYGCEIEPNNFVIRIKKQIGMNRGYEARIKKNIMGITFKDASRALVTRMFSQMKDGRTFIGLPASNLTTGEYALLNAVPGAIVGGTIRVNYLISPNAAFWSNTTNTYYDGEIINQDIEDPLELLKATRQALQEQEVPAIDVDLSAADIHRIDPTEPIVDLGDTIKMTDGEMQINGITARVMELREPLFDPGKQPSFTLANFYLRDYNDILADLDKSKQMVDRIISGGKVTTSAFETFAAQAVYDINNSKSEVIYDERGIVLRSKLIPNDIVVVSSKGIYVSRNNGETAEAAITAEGVMAPKVIGKLGNFVEIEIGTGNNVFKANQSGINLGNQTFNSSPFRVDMAGNLNATKATITGTINATGGTFAGNITAYGTITGGTITGATIQTSLNYPRSEMSVVGNLFGSYSSANKSVTIEALNGYSSSPGIVFRDFGINVFMYADAPFDEFSIFTPRNIQISANGPNGIKLNSSKVVVNGWGNLYSQSGRTIQQELDEKISQAAANMTYGVNLAFDHITRNLKMYNANGNTIATVTIP
ncbi:prophage endopeptidase tail family protein [Cohnella sp.]|uniref:prophage endopeptidase tail family protein n=1 Tax=Cohnella sp. TaxID=1883426 RepID=UPI003704595D